MKKLRIIKQIIDTVSSIFITATVICLFFASFLLLYWVVTVLI